LDTFCEKLNGSWKYFHNVDGSDMHQIHIVEEVMRSCGGAIQGIREGLQYLNRADDGFVFFDCGTYSYGSLQGVATTTTTTSLGPLSFARNQRLWISSSVKEGSVLMERFNPNTWNSQNSERIPWIQPVMISRPNYHEEKIVRCRMANRNDPWRMQRVRWESKINQKIDRENTILRSNSSSALYSYWIETWENPDTSEWNMGTGVLCQSTGSIKEVIRQYSSSENMLVQVALHEGILLK
jgi:hypothetical protein